MLSTATCLGANASILSSSERDRTEKRVTVYYRMMFESVVIGTTIAIVLILYAFNINWLQFANVHTKGAVTTAAQAPEKWQSNNTYIKYI